MGCRIDPLQVLVTNESGGVGKDARADVVINPQNIFTFSHGYIFVWTYGHSSPRTCGKRSNSSGFARELHFVGTDFNVQPPRVRAICEFV